MSGIQMSQSRMQDSIFEQTKVEPKRKPFNRCSDGKRLFVKGR